MLRFFTEYRTYSIKIKGNKMKLIKILIPLLLLMQWATAAEIFEDILEDGCRDYNTTLMQEELLCAEIPSMPALLDHNLTLPEYNFKPMLKKLEYPIQLSMERSQGISIRSYGISKTIRDGSIDRLILDEESRLGSMINTMEPDINSDIEQLSRDDLEYIVKNIYSKHSNVREAVTAFIEEKIKNRTSQGRKVEKIFSEIIKRGSFDNELH